MPLDARLAVTGVALLFVGSALLLPTGVSVTVSAALATLAVAGLAVAAARLLFPSRRLTPP